MPADITAILLPLPPRGPSPDHIINVVAQAAQQSGQSAAWIRLLPLEKVDIHQLEVLDGGSGLPAVSPVLLTGLSQGGNKAMFVHVNHQAKQALMHAFEDGIEVDSYSGEVTPQFEEQFKNLTGHSIDELVSHDDGTRVGFGQAASRTAAIVRGRMVLAPTGTPTGLGSFSFHDRGHDRAAEQGQIQLTDAEDRDEGEGDVTRAAFFAFDGGIIAQAFTELPGQHLAQVVSSAQPEVLGPLIELRDATAKQLATVQTPPGQAKDHPAWHTNAFELLALAHAGAFAGGDTVKFIDQKLLPILAIGDAAPIIDSDDAEELDELPSILDAMIEVLPCPKPPTGYGPLLENIGPDELGALVPWAKPGQAYDGSVFLVKADRLLQLVRGFDAQKLAGRLDKFCRALYTARGGDVTDEKAYLEWRAGWEQRSAQDIERLLLAWAELRVVLELAAVNQMNIGLIVYG
jgi:hypothetical protein